MLSKHQLRAGVGTALAIGALAAPAASASPIHDGMSARPDTQVVSSAPAGRQIDPLAFSRQDKQAVSTAPATTGSAHVTASPSPGSPVATSDGGFDWGDAGIGAAGGLVLAMGGLGGALAISRRRTGPSGRTAPVPS